MAQPVIWIDIHRIKPDRALLAGRHGLPPRGLNS